MNTTALDELTAVMLAISGGDFTRRVRRTHDGSQLDVMSFLVNAVADELEAHQAQRVDRLRARQFAALGRIAAGVAHELNNPLAHLTLSLELLLDSVDGGALDAGRLRAELTDCRASVRRMARVLGNIRQFAHPISERVPDVFDLREAARVAARTCVATLGDKARVSIEGGSVMVQAERDDIVQVMVNLLTNAALAYGDERSGPVCITTSAEGGYAVVRVADQGEGIDPRIADSLFEPFVSTRHGRGGSGLGLAISAELLQRAGGAIRVESTSTAGTVMRAALPLADRDPEASEPQSWPAMLVGLRVLVVDDDGLVRGALGRMLSRFHEVEVVGGGAEALEALGQRTFDLVLCDVVMPGMDGPELLERARELHPDAASRWVLMTGGDVTKRLTDAVDDQSWLLHKPFPPRTLLSTIASVVAARGRA